MCSNFNIQTANTSRILFSYTKTHIDSSSFEPHQSGIGRQASTRFIYQTHRASGIRGVPWAPDLLLFFLHEVVVSEHILMQFNRTFPSTTFYLLHVSCIHFGIRVQHRCQYHLFLGKVDWFRSCAAYCPLAEPQNSQLAVHKMRNRFYFRLALIDCDNEVCCQTW